MLGQLSSRYHIFQFAFQGPAAVPSHNVEIRFPPRWTFKRDSIFGLFFATENLRTCSLQRYVLGLNHDDPIIIVFMLCLRESVETQMFKT